MLLSLALALMLAKPAVVVRLSQSVGQAPVSVRVVATIRDPDQMLQCPGWRIEFGDGCVSERWSDCDPYAQVEERPKVWTVIPTVHHYRQPGDYDITVSILGQQSDLKGISGRAKLVLVGREGLGNDR